MGCVFCFKQYVCSIFSLAVTLRLSIKTVSYRTLTRCKEDVLLFRFPLGKWSLILTEIER